MGKNSAKKAQRSKRDRLITDRLVDRAVDRMMAAERIAQQVAWDTEHHVMSNVAGETGPAGFVTPAYV
jgi:hypothetical protein